MRYSQSLIIKNILGKIRFLSDTRTESKLSQYGFIKNDLITTPIPPIGYNMEQKEYLIIPETHPLFNFHVLSLSNKQDPVWFTDTVDNIYHYVMMQINKLLKL